MNLEGSQTQLSRLEALTECLHVQQAGLVLVVRSESLLEEQLQVIRILRVLVNRPLESLKKQLVAERGKTPGMR